MEIGVTCMNCKEDFDIEVAGLIDIILCCAKKDIVFEGICCGVCSEEAFKRGEIPEIVTT